MIHTSGLSGMTCLRHVHFNVKRSGASLLTSWSQANGKHDPTSQSAGLHHRTALSCYCWLFSARLCYAALDTGRGNGSFCIGVYHPGEETPLVISHVAHYSSRAFTHLQAVLAYRKLYHRMSRLPRSSVSLSYTKLSNTNNARLRHHMQIPVHPTGSSLIAKCRALHPHTSILHQAPLARRLHGRFPGRMKCYAGQVTPSTGAPGARC